MFSLRPVFQSSLLTLLVVLVLPSASVVVAQPVIENATLVTSDDKNTDSSLLMTNYNALREEGQGFFRVETTELYEKPDSAETVFVALHWWCDLEFSSEDATNNYGYVGRAVSYYWGSSLDDVVAQGAQTFPSKKGGARSVSAVLVPSLGIFEGQIHKTTDDWVERYWDDGSSTLQVLGWEGHDEGDTTPNADTSAFSSFGTYTKITTEAAAELLGLEVADLTPATCSTEYAAAWNATHVPDPIETSVTELEDSVAQLHADNTELRSRIVAIEGSLSATGSGSGSGADGEAPAATSSSSPFRAALEQATMDIVMNSIVTVAVIIGLVVN